jgi:SNF2 family DNA or RNA helicase
LKVVNTQPFQLIYTLTEHPHLGYVIEPHVIQINSLGNYTLTHQHIYSQTAEYYETGIDDDDRRLFKILDEMQPEVIVKRFYKKAKIRPAEFFQKHLSPVLFAEQVRPYIEKRMVAAMELLREKPMFLTGNDGNPTSKKITIASEKSTVLFHFRRNEISTRYFATIKYKAERIDFMQKDAKIITTLPAWILLNNHLYDFAKDVDGRKLQPFLNKRYIEIPRQAEHKYFEKFVVPLIEKYDVYAEGFEIISEKIQAVPVIKLGSGIDNELLLVLQFRYGSHAFPYHFTKKVSVSLEVKNEQYRFRRIKRSVEWEEGKRSILEKMGLILQDGSGFSLHNPLDPESAPPSKYQLIDWLYEHHQTLQQQGFIITQNETGPKYHIGKREVNLSVKEVNDWFDILGTVTFGDIKLPFVKLKDHILKGKREYVLPSGDIAIIPEEWFAQFRHMLYFSTEQNSIQLKKHHIGLLENLMSDEKFSRNLREQIINLKNSSVVHEVPLPEGFHGVLRPYQKAGFDWFYFLKQNNFGGCLADDMGLGKTIQTLALLKNEKDIYQENGTLETVAKDYNENSKPAAAAIQYSLFEGAPRENGHVLTITDKREENNVSFGQLVAENNSQPKTSLIVVPTSLVYNWASEAAKFTPDLKVLTYTGTYREKEMDQFNNYDIILTTYGIARLDHELLKHFYFNYIILDESQNIKNPFSQISKAVNLLKSRNKLVLTGTPVENSVTDLWSQMSFVNPGLLGTYNFFHEKFAVPIEKMKDQQQIEKLQALVKPFILRRTKKQVASDLPDKTEQLYYCEMTEEQSKAYELTKSFYRNEILKSISQVGFKKSQLFILQGLIRLRQISNHPLMTDQEFLGESGKFNEVISMTETAITEGHKVLMFSSFVKQLTLFREHFDREGTSYCYLDGAMNNKQRQENVRKFQEDEGIKLFLISLKAGGVGLNLTAADYVFILDPWWNPAVEKQAENRAHRIGQTKNVFTYKFISKNTVEEKILSLQARKSQLAENLIRTEESFMKTLNENEILAMLD